MWQLVVAVLVCFALFVLIRLVLLGNASRIARPNAVQSPIIRARDSGDPELEAWFAGRRARMLAQGWTEDRVSGLIKAPAGVTSFEDPRDVLPSEYAKNGWLLCSSRGALTFYLLEDKQLMRILTGG